MVPEPIIKSQFSIVVVDDVKHFSVFRRSKKSLSEAQPKLNRNATEDVTTVHGITAIYGRGGVPHVKCMALNP